MTPDPAEEFWAIVLAGGQGRRLRELTRILHGEERPKQFALIGGERSLLQETMERIAPVVPAERTVVVVHGRYEDLARRQLAGYPGVEIVAQPADRDTGPGLLLPLARVMAHSTGSVIAVFPSDHHVTDSEPFLGAVRTAVAAARRHPMRVFLLGAEAAGPEVEYGWIVPDPELADGEPDAVRRVLAFVEKPDAATAERLFSTGALWNTFVLVGTSAAYWNLARHLLPDHAAMFTAYAVEVGSPREAAMREIIYRLLRPANFSREVLERTGDLGVVRMDGSGWSDWGTPRLVFRSLEGTPALPDLLRRLEVAGSRLPVA